MWPFSSPSAYRNVQNLRSSYDYIIVGGGNAGCVLARRLAEGSGGSVLLVEKGDSGDSWLHRTPLPSLYHWSDGKHSTVFESQTNVELGHPSTLITGLGLGGSTRINGGQYTCGVPAQYNLWNQANQQRSGWSYQDMKPFFEKSEAFLGPDPQEYHGLNGPLTVRSFESFNYHCAERAFEAAQAVGFANIEDIRSPLAPCIGVNKMQFTVGSDGTRQSSFRAYLPQTFLEKHHDTLHICTKTYARKIHFDSEKTQVVAVEVQGVGSTSKRTISANREVILACGALFTPQLLHLSGIGPRESLDALKIPVVKDLPGVGSNLQDHLLLPVSYYCSLEDSLWAMVRRPKVLIQQLYQYLRHGRGWFLGTMAEVEVFGRSDRIDPDGKLVKLNDDELDASIPSNLPDFSILSCPICDPQGDGIDQSRGFMGLIAALLRPKSVGQVRLASTDPLAKPECSMNYLTSPSDIVALRSALKALMSIARAMQDAGYAIEGLPNRTPGGMDNDTLDAYIRANADTMFHYSSSCRMAPEDDELPGVVDDRLKVHGVKSLRICDASVFPDSPATHPQSLVYVFAEKCASMILDQK